MFAGSVVLTAIEGLDDVGVIEELAAFGLTAEAVDIALAAGQLVVQHLDRDLDVFTFFPAEIDRPHAAFAEPAQEAVFAEPAQVVQRIRPMGRPGRVQVGVVHALSAAGDPLTSAAHRSVPDGWPTVGGLLERMPGRIRVNLPQPGVQGNKENGDPLTPS